MNKQLLRVFEFDKKRPHWLVYFSADHARHITKLQLRQPTIDRLVNKREEDIDHFVNFTTKDSIQKSLGMYLEALKKKSAKKRFHFRVCYFLRFLWLHLHNGA